LEPVLLELGRWGSSESVTTSRELTSDALMVALQTAFAPHAAADATYLVDIDRDAFTVTIAGGTLAIRRGQPAQADATISADAATIRAVAVGRETIAAAERAGRLTVEGDRELADRFTRLFPVSRPQTP